MNKERTLIDFIELAKERAGIRTDAELARRLGKNRVMIAQYRNGDVLPGEDTMLKLARIIWPGDDETSQRQRDQSLLYLQVWNTQKAFRSPDARAAYERLLVFFQHNAAALFLALALLFAPPALALGTSDINAGGSVYYGK